MPEILYRNDSKHRSLLLQVLMNGHPAGIIEQDLQGLFYYEAMNGDTSMCYWNICDAMSEAEKRLAPPRDNP